MRLKNLLRRGTTFALLLFGLFAILAPDPVSAQLLVGKAGPFASLPPCSLDPIYNSAGRFAVVTDATVTDGVIVSGSGTPALGYCELDGGDWLAFAFTNPSGISAAADITIAASGTTKNVAVTATGNITLSPVVTHIVDVAGGADEWTTVAGKSTYTGLLIGTPQTATCTDSGDGSPGALTLLPTANSIEITNSDADGCAVTMSETGMASGTEFSIAVVSTAGGNVSFADTSGVTELTGAIDLGLYDTLRLLYTTSRYVMLGTSNN